MAESTAKTEFQYPSEQLEQIAKDNGMDVTDFQFAELMDNNDHLKEFRNDFHYPKMKELGGTDSSIVNPEEDCIYFCGNSLGLCPVNVRKYLNEEVDKWEKTGVQGHRNGARPWAWCDELLEEEMAKIVGANREEVGLMNGLTVNLHLLLISFYRPTKDRYKILLESKAFPSDHYTFESHSKLHGYIPEDAMICIEPREGEATLRTEDILAVIEKEGDKIAVVCFSGIQYYTGQFFDIPTITKAGHAKGCTVGWDLAHAAGNLPLYLHDWGVDFACWCTYKYLCASAGGIAGLFVHENHRTNDFPHLSGWWGHQMSTRFVMDNKMDLIPGARGFRISNSPIFLCAPLAASLDVFKKTNMEDIRRKSVLLTGYLEVLLRKYFKRPENSKKEDDGKEVYVDIFTPSDPRQRGAQLSLSFNIEIQAVMKELEKRGVTCDMRLPSVIRIAPCPLYCSFNDVHRFIKTLQDALTAAAKSS